MIKIPISQKQKQKIEKLYWDWISSYHLQKFATVVNNDQVLHEFIFNGEKYSAMALKKFLLSSCGELENLKARLDIMRTKNKHINQVTKEYLKSRYTNYRNTQAGKIINVLGITVCPYCNQNLLNVVYREGRIRYWGDLDHFYSKNDYPELSICLYNLIPVCKVCNQLKSSKKRIIANPFDLKKKSKIKFRTEFDEKFDLRYLQGKSKNFNIVIDKECLTKEDEEEIELFDLENRYKELKQNAQEIIIKSKAYEEIYIKYLQEKFSLSESELDAYIFGYNENHLDRSLSKFNLDIMNEFRNLKASCIL